MMMLRLAEGLRLPLGADDFADYARAMEAAHFRGSPCPKSQTEAKSHRLSRRPKKP